MKNALLYVLKSRLIWYAVLGCLLFCLGIHFYTQWDLARFEAEMLASKRRPTSKRKAETEAAIANPDKPTKTQDRHFHADGNPLHAEPHETEAPVVSPSVSAAGGVSETALVQIPEGVTDAEVLAAWQRLDYIAKNPFEWGGRPSARALELMDELPPMWIIDDPHDHGEELMMMLDLLSEERDPRSAALLVTYLLDSGVSGRPVDEALVAMGPAAVPALITRLNPEKAEEDFLKPIIRDVVVPIVFQHREELGGIVDHIILPRLEAIAALEDPPGDTFVVYNRSGARKALALLRE